MPRKKKVEQDTAEATVEEAPRSKHVFVGVAADYRQPNRIPFVATGDEAFIDAAAREVEAAERNATIGPLGYTTSV